MDDIDKKLLDFLEINGRETISTLAGKVGLSRTSVKERIDRLERDGEIQAYTIKRKTSSAGPRTRAYLMIKTNGALCHEIAPILEKMPEVRFFESISGDIDALVCVETETPDELGLLRDKIAGFHQVTDIQTLSVMKTRIDWR
ncbi:Lrp/AsnC family transcriptional regulator [Terasakiella sp. A23]|uniref:Lrp/AsnC family transcriptional regulator n=1 Tax=Terasakiella sp. FCG-A23 TaxID=3080561 RepID=UPI00295299B0|nr:Lrp/AsnC family transcriptional regulator [Terasakiella sp. A23]MDV7338171.1 Lrp/AsnC family transcriptional regulator [Terasakiella sp. A23]